MTVNEKLFSLFNIFPDFPSDNNKISKIIHWNINGFTKLLKTKELDILIKQENPDIICFNETKISQEFLKKINVSNIFNNQL